MGLRDIPGVTELTGLRVGGGQASPAGRGVNGPIPATSEASDGASLLWLSRLTASIVTVTVTGGSSVTTAVSVPGVQPGDLVDVYISTSSLSASVVPTAHPSATTGTVILRYSNCSTANNVQTPVTPTFLVRRFVS